MPPDSYDDVIDTRVQHANDAHFRVKAHLDGPLVDCDITVDRARQLLKVRQKGRGAFVALPLQQVAEMVYSRAVKERIKRESRLK